MEIIQQLIINSLITGSIYALIALSFNLIYRTAKFFNLAHGVMATIGGYTTFFLSIKLGWSVSAGIFLGIIFAGFCGYLSEKIIFLPLRKKKASRMVPVVASLGIFTAIPAIVSILFSTEFQTLYNSSTEEKIYNILGGVITQTQIIIIFIAILVTAIIGIILKFTVFGKSIRAISDDEEVSKIIGIHTDKIIGRVFFFSSSIAGLAGILYGFDVGIEPTMGLRLILLGIVACIIGGINSITGSILGAFLIGFGENLGVWFLPGGWKDAIAYALLILFLIFKPNGIIKE